MKYEFEIVNYGRPYFHESTLSTLTGLEFDDVHSFVKSIGKKKWGGQLYINALQNLGFNTNPRFVKFNPDTNHPCILRCRNHEKGIWYLFYYCNGIVYDVWDNSFELTDFTNVAYIKGSYFLKNYQMKVTSMLEVWV
ncbi:hypothetical protein ACF3OC_08285 [Sphingobacterium cellulitidis]|uniref:hypothetical protein n=1 Tax=Sphingobacterium cellulitidis TaxID=1768011 RepID=UPI00370D474C